MKNTEATKGNEMKICPICKGEYERTYEEHTGSQKHRQAVWSGVGRQGSPPAPVVR